RIAGNDPKKRCGSFPWFAAPAATKAWRWACGNPGAGAAAAPGDAHSSPGRRVALVRCSLPQQVGPMLQSSAAVAAGAAAGAGRDGLLWDGRTGIALVHARALGRRGKSPPTAAAGGFGLAPVGDPGP